MHFTCSRFGLLGRFLVVEGGMNDIALWNTHFQRYLKITGSGSDGAWTGIWNRYLEQVSGTDLKRYLKRWWNVGTMESAAQRSTVSGQTCADGWRNNMEQQCNRSAWNAAQTCRCSVGLVRWGVMGCGLANVRKFSWRLVAYSKRMREDVGGFRLFHLKSGMICEWARIRILMGVNALIFRFRSEVMGHPFASEMGI